ncbi:ABC transporter permease/M1 family aminopeptidase [Crocosphaera sp. Alani8]|uniref:ABC transporter permease/M1 family aminopeptidase n=1 Tax=Crocosphaera sp. Alani8 TaxID=3038952 RepID=UPI00313EF0D4
MKQATLPIVKFEIFYHLQRPTFWIISLLFFGIALMDSVSNASQGQAFFFMNSPSQIFQTTIWYTIFGIVAAAAFVAETFVRDANHRMEGLILSTPISKWNYLGLRFLSAVGMTLLAFSGYLPGTILGTLMPGLNPYALGPFRPDAYIFSYFLFVIPNLFLASAIAFLLASRTRNLAITYAGAIVLVMLYLASLMMVGMDVINFSQYRFWSMFDPFGFHAFEETRLGWTVYQHNTLMPNLTNTLLLNRLLWVTVGLVACGFSYQTYSLKMLKRSPQKKARDTGGEKNVSTQRQEYSQTWKQSNTSQLLTIFQQRCDRSLFEIRWILQGRAFWLLTGFGLITLVMTALGTGSYNYSNPSTDLLIHAANVYFEYILFAIIVIYAAELMWRDRQMRIQDVIDATPISNGVLLLSKLTALFVMISFNLLLAMVVMIPYQALNGYYDFEIPLYLQMLFVEHGPYFYLIAVLSLFTQVITQHKYAGMALAIAIALSKIPLDAFGLYHNLYRFASTNDIEYSLMNGYGNLLTGHLWYSLYWGVAGAILMAIAYIIWPRGTAKTSWGKAWKQANAGIKRTLFALIALFAGVGGWIAYNTMVVNPYQPPGKEETAAEIEKRFNQYENLPMPVVVSTDVNVEMFPDQGYFVANGTYGLENRTDTPIKEIHLLTFINLDLAEVNYPGAKLKEAHPEWGYYIYTLDRPLMPGERENLEFTTKTEATKGFRNQVDSDDVYMVYPNDVVGNGTNLHSPFILPFVGYTKMVEHKKAWLRDKLDLPPLEERMRSYDDEIGLSQALSVSHLGWGEVNITVSTSADQQVITSGTLLKQWQEGDRNYFQYQLEAPDRGKFTLFSGRYGVHKNNNYRVPIEIYYHPQHKENVELMANHIGEALEFYEKIFGPYPFEQVRVVEFVYYDGMVFSDRGTIGIPEVLVWKNTAQGLGKENIIDWLTYLLAYAWWEDQMVIADVSGSMTIREALSAYGSSLYQRYRRSPEIQELAKKQQMRTFFRQLGKLDFQEPALIEVYNELAIARYKGGMVLELIEDLIGQEALLTAIREFFGEYRYQNPPYATVIDFQDAILRQTPPKYKETIAELFAEVITYQVGLTNGFYEKLPDGKFKITLDIEAQKIYTRELGRQEITELDIPLTIALSDQQGNTIYEQKHEIDNQSATLELIIDQLPSSATVDPDYVLPSAFVQDNVRILREKTPQN